MHFYSSEADSRGEDDGGSRFTLSPVFEAELSAMEAKRRDLNVRLVDGAGSLSPTEFGGTMFCFALRCHRRACA